MMSLILFFGSVFVAIVLTLLSHLMQTAKTRSIDIAEVLVGVIDARDPNLNGHSRKVTEEKLRSFVEAARLCPSSVNVQPLKESGQKPACGGYAPSGLGEYD